MGWVPMKEDAGDPDDPEGRERGAVGGEMSEWSAEGYDPYDRGLLPSPLSFAPPQTTPLNALNTPVAPPISRSNRSGFTREKS